MNTPANSTGILVFSGNANRPLAQAIDQARAAHAYVRGVLDAANMRLHA